MLLTLTPRHALSSRRDRNFDRGRSSMRRGPRPCEGRRAGAGVTSATSARVMGCSVRGSGGGHGAGGGRSDARWDDRARRRPSPSGRRSAVPARREYGRSTARAGWRRRVILRYPDGRMDVEPGVPRSAPAHSESLDAMLRDVQQMLLPGITHWNHPAFFAYSGH